MSVSGIGSCNCQDSYNMQGPQGRMQQFKQGLQQLGQDLQAGDLSKAQQDYVTLTQGGTSGTQATNSIAQDFSAIGQALQSGNLADAQKAFATLQQDAQQMSGSGGHHHHHHRHAGGGSQGSNSISGNSNPFVQDFSALGQALQSGDLSAAQQAFAKFQQDVQQFVGNGSNNNTSSNTQTSSSSSSTQTATNSLNVIA